MRKHLAMALPGMVVLNRYSQPLLRQNLATGIASKQVRWGFHITYQHSCYAANSTKSASSIYDITGTNWYYNEKQPFVYCTAGIGALNVGKQEKEERVRRVDIPTIQYG